MDPETQSIAIGSVKNYLYTTTEFENLEDIKRALRVLIETSLVFLTSDDPKGAAEYCYHLGDTLVSVMHEKQQLTST